SPGEPANEEPVTVVFKIVPPDAVADGRPSTENTRCASMKSWTRPKVVPVTVKRLSVPDELISEKFLERPPLIMQLVMTPAPVIPVVVVLPKYTAPSPAPSGGAKAALVPLVPLTVAYSSVKLLTELPRIPKFWFVPLIVIRRKVRFDTLSA